MDVIHYAAQNDNYWAIVYFHNEMAMDIDNKDNDENTPLHWACYFGASNAASYLLKWTHSINKSNINGDTSLHLATKIALTTSVRKLVRLLCFHGADRNAVDNTGRKPIDYVKEAEECQNYSGGITKELKNILKKPNDCMCLMSRIPTMKIKNSIKYIVYFYIIQFLTEFLLIPLTIPRVPYIIYEDPVNFKIEDYVVIIQVTLFVIILERVRMVTKPSLRGNGGCL